VYKQYVALILSEKGGLLAAQVPLFARKQDLPVQVRALADTIARTQLPDGRIPWSAGAKTDPWDHVEAAMGLTIGGLHGQARKAFEWLRKRQLGDGSWYAAYGERDILDFTRESNHAAYICVGLYHYYLITGDLGFVRRLWPTITAAMDFVLNLQAPGGEIYWALNPRGEVDPMALLTGSSSICFSLKCALALSRLVGCDQPRWRSALRRLEACIADKPQHFNMTKSRFSMDWFYPVLCGAIQGRQAQARIDKYWKKFVIQDVGVLCVSDQPWVTIAESCELVLTLAAMGNSVPARIVFSWICDRTFADHTFWCGFTFPDMVLWPAEKITWTNAVALMAADALYDLTPAGRLFNHGFWEQMRF
jgi:hypothetical protein